MSTQQENVLILGLPDLSYLHVGDSYRLSGSCSWGDEGRDQLTKIVYVRQLCTLSG